MTFEMSVLILEGSIGRAVAQYWSRLMTVPEESHPGRILSCLVGLP